MLPIEFKERMTKLLGAESEAFFAEIENREAVRSFRVNGIKISAEEFEATNPKIERHAMSFPDGAYYTEEEYPGSLPCHHAGMIYMQDPSAMATVYAANIDKGAKILDSCSAPGGKTTQLAAFAGDFGVVVANEYEARRCRILQGNVERLGCRNTVVVNLDTAILAETYPERFDVVLCDAPCSGEGMFRKNDRAIEEWSLDNVRMCADRQREILSNVVKCVAPGGKLIYSTCTFSLEENEMNVAWLLDSFTDFKLVEVDPALKAVTSDGICFLGCEHDMTKARRFYPHVSKGEGQFVAVFERDEGVIAEADEPKQKKKDKKKKSANDGIRRDDAILLEATNEFLRENLCDGFENGVKYELISLGGKAYLKPDIDLPKYGVFAAGVCVGEIVGKKFTPHHQLFSAFGNSFIRRVLLEQGNPDTDAYLKGLEFDANDICSSGKSDGWAAVLVDGCPVGGGKIVDGKCKNHYPKGLRNKQ